MASGGDGQLFANVSTTQGPFKLNGGEYGFTATATWGGGNVQLQLLGPDQATWIAAAQQISANGFQVLDLPPGQYQIVVTTATAVYVAIARINF